VGSDATQKNTWGAETQFFLLLKKNKQINQIKSNQSNIMDPVDSTQSKVQQQRKKENQDALLFKKQQKELYGTYGTTACYLDKLIAKYPSVREELIDKMYECSSKEQIPDTIIVRLPLPVKSKEKEEEEEEEEEKRDKLFLKLLSRTAMIRVLDITPVPMRLKWSVNKTRWWYSSVIMKKIYQTQNLKLGNVHLSRVGDSFFTTSQYEEVLAIRDIFFPSSSHHTIHIPYPHNYVYSWHAFYIESRYLHEYNAMYNKHSFTPLTELYSKKINAICQANYNNNNNNTNNNNNNEEVEL